MKKTFLPLFALTAMSIAVKAQTPQIPFSDQSALLPTSTFHSGNTVGVCDMNNDGKDDIVRASQNTTMYIEYQNAPNATFTENSYTNNIGAPWGMCVGDVNNDGYNDVLWGDGTTYVLVRSGTTYTGTDVTASTNASSIFVQGSNFADINNDSYLDAFVCDDVGLSHIYVNNGGTGWTFDQSLIPLATVPISDNSGNYASIWTDINNDGLMDLHITHCRQGVNNSNDARRIDQIFINNGNGTFTQDITNWTNLRDGAQGWSSGWGDIDNDGDMDVFILNYDVNSKLMINNGNGVFTDAMTGSGINNTTTIFGENATFDDYNNDGYVDLFISGSAHLLYINNGNGTFTQDVNAFTYSNYTITAHATGDLNGDGFLDVYASYCDIYNTPSNRNDKLWMNTSIAAGNTNNWVKFFLNGGATAGMSNKNGVGAIVKIYGPWGVQVREVHSGQAYGIQNSFTMHFGLGQNTALDSATVTWPSGIVDHLATLNGNTSYTVNEGQHPLAVGNLNSNPLFIGVYPNPAMQSDITINLKNFTTYGLNNLSIQMYDLNGKLVYSEAKLNSSTIFISRELLNSGMYFIEVRNGDQRLATEKIMVE
jgi:ASPIC and UnbV/Secretion system C-terminal sorting domain/FG-GAP-like repeat